jgi:cobalt-zinc-cadmium efflux system outer membrane protein
MTCKIEVRMRPARAAVRCFLWAAIAAAWLPAARAPLQAQAPVAPAVPGPHAPFDSARAVLDSLVHLALEANPGITAAHASIEAARAAIGPAGTLPDPMLMAGVMNHSIGGSDDPDGSGMAMRVVGIEQSIPFSGKLPLQRRVAEAELAAAVARADAARLRVVRELKTAYYELAFLDRALDIVGRNAGLLNDFVQVAGSRYRVGTGSQADVLKARVEASRVAEEAVSLAERRRAALARLNAVMNQPSETPAPDAVVPARVARAAVPASAAEVRFTSDALGARAADSPLPPLAELQETAVLRSPAIRTQQAMIEAAAARADLARRAHLPDFDFRLQYGQRSHRPDMISAVVSIPIPIHKRQRQNLAVAGADAELAALRAEHHEKANQLRAAIAEVYAELEQERAHLALFVRSIIPQGRAALESATAGFQVGRVDFLTLLENQATLYEYEIAYHRALTAFASRLADLEHAVAGEVIR